MPGQCPPSDILPFLKGLFPLSRHDQVMLVGGTVRDLLLGINPHDIDLVTTLPSDELLPLGFRLVEASSSIDIYFKHHPLFGKIEVTRIDTMADLEDDLRKRDFTINAIAMSLSGICSDPLTGKEDLESRTLRICSEKSFSGDPLRIFRAFRFEADGWNMTAETEAMIRCVNWSAALSAMPVERFSNEMLKALARKQPERFFQRMVELNTGVEFLPELFRLPSIPAGPLQHHPEGDLFSHSIQVLQRVAIETDNPLARFCGFFHDLGKLDTDPVLYPKHHGHDTIGFGMAVELCNRLSLSSAQRKALAWISALHGKANLWKTLRDSTRLTMAEQSIKADIVEILPVVARADKAGGLPMLGWDEVVRVAGMNTRELGIDAVKLEQMPIKKRKAYILQKRILVLNDSFSYRKN